MSAQTQSDLQTTAGGVVVGRAQHLNWSGIPVERVAEGIERQIVVGEKLMICRFHFAPFRLRPNTNIRTNRCRLS